MCFNFAAWRRKDHHERWVMMLMFPLITLALFLGGIVLLYLVTQFVLPLL